MADDFDAGICSGSWWRTARSGGGFDTSTMQALAASVSCSTTITDIGSGGGGGAFGWSTAEMVETKARPSDDEPSGSVSGPLIEPGFGLSPSTMDWNQSLFRSSGRAETSFHAMLQEPLSYFQPDSSIETDHQVHGGTQDMNQPFLLDQQQQPGFPMMLQGLFEPETKLQQSNIFDSRLLNYQSSPPMMIGNYHGSSNDSLDQKFPQFLKSLPLKQQTTTNQLQFSNNAPFWNASATAISEARSGFYPSTPVHFVTQGFEQKPSCSNHTTKSNSDSMSKKSGTSSEPALKKPRIEAPPPLPTFKVRKEKLGDRITALQQLVSPFGKTDTASVLHEAIDYIKFLHEQVSVYSSPYLKNGHPMQHQQNSHESKDGEGPKQDLRSRGLCLVPIEITDPVASETTADFWTPSFGGTYR